MGSAHSPDAQRVGSGCPVGGETSPPALPCLPGRPGARVSPWLAVTAGQPRLLRTIPGLLGGSRGCPGVAHHFAPRRLCPAVWKSALMLTGPGTSGRLSPLRSLARTPDPQLPRPSGYQLRGRQKGAVAGQPPIPAAPPTPSPPAVGRGRTAVGCQHLSAGSRSPSRPPLPPLSLAGRPLANPWAGAPEVWLESQPHPSSRPREGPAGPVSHGGDTLLQA